MPKKAITTQKSTLTFLLDTEKRRALRILLMEEDIKVQEFFEHCVDAKLANAARKRARQITQP